MLTVIMYGAKCPLLLVNTGHCVGKTTSMQYLNNQEKAFTLMHFKFYFCFIHIHHFTEVYCFYVCIYNVTIVFVFVLRDLTMCFRLFSLQYCTMHTSCRTNSELTDEIRRWCAISL